MKLPVPIDTQSVLKNNNVLLKTSNLGLLFNKYASVWSDDWTTEEKRGKDKVNLKSEFLNKIEKQSICVKEGKAIVDSLCKRQSKMIQSLKSSGWHVEPFNGTTDSRLIIGLGGTSVIETGMTLHPLYGFPYLPGSGLKGLARAYAEIAEVASIEELHDIFGSEDKQAPAANNRQGRVFFMDGLPTTFPKLELDIMNPHYSEYYQGHKPPADYLNPVPVTFLAVAQGQQFSFAIYSRDKELAEKAKPWLISGLTDLGAGGKTNVGYGYFKIESPTVTPDKNKPVAVEEDTSLASRLKAVKNPQTFVDFMKGIKQDEVETLRVSSLKESGINIGLIEYLESAEVSAEIKRIIANKILEVTTPNKKWDEKKREKYKKLQLIAGVANV
jgi:CRISPR-associated protein Cmr6